MLGEKSYLQIIISEVSHMVHVYGDEIKSIVVSAFQVRR